MSECDVCHGDGEVCARPHGRECASHRGDQGCDGVECPKCHGLGPGHYHEAMDRALVARETFAMTVEAHPAVQADPRLKEAAAAIVDGLDAFYQLAGQVHSEKSK